MFLAALFLLLSVGAHAFSSSCSNCDIGDECCTVGTKNVCYDSFDECCDTSNSANPVSPMCGSDCCKLTQNCCGGQECCEAGEVCCPNDLIVCKPASATCISGTTAAGAIGAGAIVFISLGSCVGCIACIAMVFCLCQAASGRPRQRQFVTTTTYYNNQQPGGVPQPVVAAPVPQYPTPSYGATLDASQQPAYSPYPPQKQPF
jgi:hypothetical protein